MDCASHFPFQLTLSLVLHMIPCRFWDSDTKLISMIQMKIFKRKKEINTTIKHPKPLLDGISHWNTMQFYFLALKR